MAKKKTAKHSLSAQTENAVELSVIPKKSADENEKIIYFNRV
jgi:hypothetical protein